MTSTEEGTDAMEGADVVTNNKEVTKAKAETWKQQRLGTDIKKRYSGWV